MDYEKKYNEALKWMRELYPGLHGATKEDAEHYFPELRESEAEKIRKELVAFFIEVRNREGNEGYWHDLKVADILSYLEKQKEQKSVDSNDMINAILSALASGLETDEILKARGFTYDEVEKWLDSTRNPAIEYIRGQNKIFENPEKYGLCKKPAWSEEDEKMLSDLRNTLGCLMNAGAITFKTKKKFSNWLKSLRPQSKQEWSEEDEKKIHFLSRLIEFQVKDDEYCFGEGSCAISKQEAIKMLKSLRPVKQEWSKKDEDKLYQVMETLLADKTVALRETPRCKALHEAYDEMLAWLKSLPERFNLQLKQEWSEEDETILDSVIRIITHVDDLANEPTFAGPKWTHPYSKEIRFLNKLRNRLFEEND